MSQINKYRRPIPARAIRNGGLDVYDVLTAFGVTCPAIQHAIKKMLCPGTRGAKDRAQDITEAIASLTVAHEYTRDARDAEPLDIPAPIPREV